jgi:hypothetical protein
MISCIQPICGKSSHTARYPVVCFPPVKASPILCAVLSSRPPGTTGAVVRTCSCSNLTDMMKVACGQLRPTGSTCQVGLAIKSRAVSAQIDETADDENIADERELLTKGRGLGAEALFRLVEGMGTRLRRPGRRCVTRTDLRTRVSCGFVEAGDFEP